MKELIKTKATNGNYIYGNYENEENEKINSVVCEIIGYDPFDDYYWVKNKEGIEEFCDFEPIPLTEEWLLKFGFEKSNNNTEFYTFDLSKLSIHLKSKQYADGRTYFNSWCIIEKQIEYVHQLQNLYFALTQEELKIK